MSKIVPGIYSTTTYKMMYSDGPETISSSNVPCTLLAYKQNSQDTSSDGTAELTMPENLELGMYHNNHSGSTVKFAVLLKNNASTRIKVNVYSSEAILTSYSSDDTKEKVEGTVAMEVTHNKGNYSKVQCYVDPGECEFAYEVDVPNYKLINSRMRIMLSGTDCSQTYIRVVCCATGADPNDVWTQTNSKYPACDSGQFSGVVNYCGKGLNVTMDNIGDYFTIFNTESTVSNDAEFTTVYYHKPNGKKVFAGNYSVPYSFDIEHPKSSNLYLRITPYSANEDNKYSTLAYCADGSKWEALNSGEALVRGSGSWTEHYYIPLDKTGETWFDLILPGGNCGVLTCTLVSGKN